MAERKEGALPVISIVGTSGSGKTMLLSNLIPVIRGEGYSVGVIKHHGHRGGRIDKPGKDTFLLREAGAEVTVLSGPDINAATAAGEEDPYAIVERQMAGRVDLVLTEGYKHGPFPKIGIIWPHRPDQPEPDETWIATVSGEAPGLPCFDIHTPGPLARFIIEWMEKHRRSRDRKESGGKGKRKAKGRKTARADKAPEVVLEVNGREIELNRFVASFIESTVRGMLASLKDCDEPEETVIRIRHGR